MNKTKHVILALIFGLLAVAGALTLLEGGGLTIVYAAPLNVNVSGHITVDTTWTLANSPYTMTSSVIVDPGVTLTIEPGVIVQGGNGIELQIQGHLEAVGTATQPITFTSATNTGAGQWNGVVFDGGTGNLKYTTIRYGGRDTNSAGRKSNVTIVNVASGEVRLENCRIEYEAYGGTSMRDYGLYIDSSQVVISNTTIAHNGNDLNSDYALYVTGNSTITVTNNIFANNAGYPVYLEANSVQNVYNNTFSGNGYNRIRVNGGNVSAGAKMVNQNGLDGYEVYNGDIVVPDNVTLTVESGVNVMVKDNELRVQGHLEAVGTATQPITFTSAANTGAGQWDGLVFDGGTGNLKYTTIRYGGRDTNSTGHKSNVTIANVASGEVHLENCRIEYEAYGGTSMGDYGLYIDSSQVVISNTTIAHNGNDLNSDYALYATGNSTITVTSNTFTNNAGYPVRVEANSVQNVYNNTFSGNGYNRVRVHGGNVSTGAKMVNQNGLVGYEVYNGDMVVPDSITLTVESGVNVMVKDDELRVQGHLEAVGTVTQPITFTSAANDAPGQWEGLVFDGGTGNLKYTTIRYGGQQNSQNEYSNITIQDAPPNISAVSIANSTVISSSRDGMDIEGVAIISNTLIAASANYGIYANDGTTVLDHSTIQHNDGHGIYVTDSVFFVMQCSTVYTNSGDGIRLDNNAMLIPFSSSIYDNAGIGLNNTGSVTVTAIYNWWGAADGPSGIGSGSGDEVSTNVKYTPWLHQSACLADLSITKNDAPDPVKVQTPLTYTLVVTNNGPGTANSVHITDTLSSGLQFASATLTQGTCNQSDNNITCELGEMNPNAVITITIRTTPTIVGVLTNTAVVTGTYDPILTHNTITATTTVEGYDVYLPLVLRN